MNIRIRMMHIVSWVPIFSRYECRIGLLQLTLELKQSSIALDKAGWLIGLGIEVMVSFPKSIQSHDDEGARLRKAHTLGLGKTWFYSLTFDALHSILVGEARKYLQGTHCLQGGAIVPTIYFASNAFVQYITQENAKWCRVSRGRWSFREGSQNN